LEGSWLVLLWGIGKWENHLIPLVIVLSSAFGPFVPRCLGPWLTPPPPLCHQRFRISVLTWNRGVKIWTGYLFIAWTKTPPVLAFINRLQHYHNDTFELVSGVKYLLDLLFLLLLHILIGKGCWGEKIMMNAWI
jgi:hypothetical protein